VEETEATGGAGRTAAANPAEPAAGTPPGGGASDGGGGTGVGAPAGGQGGGSGAPSLMTVAGAVASGLGVLGFVTFAGGVVMWSRFKEMGLPADHALGLVTRSELLATGADFLVPAVLLALFVVLIAVLVSNWIERRDRKRRKNAKKRGDATEALVTRLKKPKRVIAPSIIGVGGIVFSLVTLSAVPAVAFVILVGVSVLGALAVRACYDFSYPAYCLIAFLAVGTIAIVRTYERTSHRLEVLPMAYSRSQPGEAARVEVGYFVAETSDRILFASQPKGTSSSPNELREFPRTETDDLEIGGLARPEQAEMIAARFAFNLCERLDHLKPAAPSDKASSVCERSSLRRLAEKAGLPWTLDRSEQLERRLAEELKLCHTEPGDPARLACERGTRKKLIPNRPPRANPNGQDPS
jgi:hypothetical protein